MSDGTAQTAVEPQLRLLAEFRYQLRRFLSFSETESERYGIAAQQYQLMQVIGAVAPGEVASISYLAERMVLRHNSTVELVDRAERAGLVRRASDERDLRRSLVELTAHGRSVLEQMIASHMEQLQGEAGERLQQALAEVRRPDVAARDPEASDSETPEPPGKELA